MLLANMEHIHTHMYTYTEHTHKDMYTHANIHIEHIFIPTHIQIPVVLTLDQQ